MSNSATEQTPEKSNFARKCSLLSQYLKEKGSFGAIDLGLARKPESKLGLAGKPEPRENARQKAEPSEVKPFNFIQKLSGAGPSNSAGDIAKDADFSERGTVQEPGASQLTIFFGGKVIVFDEFPAGKAKEIMEMAKQANPGMSEGVGVAVASESAAEENRKNNNSSNSNKTNSHGDGNGNNNSNPVIPDLNEPSSSGNTGNHQARQQHQLVERIARRASLHRFFAKRKERAAVRAPYQVNENAGFPPKPEEAASPRLEQGESSRQAQDDAEALPKPEGHTDKLPVDEGEDECLKDLDLRL